MEVDSFFHAIEKRLALLKKVHALVTRIYFFLCLKAKLISLPKTAISFLHSARIRIVS